MSNPLVTYDATTKELRNNPAAFAEKEEYVASIVWEKDVNNNVEPGDILATIQWNDNSRESLKAPNGCAGTVSYLNKNIRFENLEYEPSQLLAQIS